MINEKEKQEKILKFNLNVGNQNNDVAIEFLSLTDWDETKAAELYKYSMPNVDTININDQNNLSDLKYITEYSFETSGFLKKVGSIFKSPFMKNNEKLCNQFTGKIKCLVKTGESFTNFLKSNKGVIILYSKNDITRLNQQLQTINNDNQNNYLNAVIIYPIINDSIEGSNLIKLLNINRFPCYLFCKYKSNNFFYILDKMEGIFYLDMFKNSLFPKSYSSYINISNNNKKDNSVNYNNNFKKIDNNENKKIIQKSNLNDNKNSIGLNNKQIPLKKEENKNKNYINNEFSILNNQNLPVNNVESNKLKENQTNIKKTENNNIINNIYNQNNINNNIQININNNIISNNKDKKINNNEIINNYNISNNNKIDDNTIRNNNNKINNNTIINNNINNNKKIDNNEINNNSKKLNDNENKSESKPKPKKEYIPDYRDYQFDNEPIIPIFKPFDLNDQILPSYSNFDFNNNQPPLSDAAIRNIQDNEMKELEKMEEEREKKEREEKEKKRKEEEEKKKIEKEEKEDKELFSKLLPPEPDDNNPDKCIIIFRLPDGEKNIQRKFLKTDKVAVLYDYIRSLGKEIYTEEDSHSFSIIQTFPFKNFENKLNNTLEEEGLFPNSMLQIKENN